MAGRSVRSVPARLGTVVLTSDHRPDAGSHWLRAFVETGSSSPCILVSLNELAEPGAVLLRHVGAGHREYGGNQGVLITVSFSGPVPDGVHLQLTLLHEGATRYQVPVVYRGA